MKKFIFYLSAALLFSCNSEKLVNDVYLIDLQKFEEGNIPLSDKTSKIEYIPLDNQFPIGLTYSYKITDNLIYASIQNVGVVSFFRNGKFNKSYGKIGRGPEEYVYCLRFAVDEKTGTVYVMDHKMNDIEVYNNNGDHIRNIKLPKDNDGFQLDAIEFFGSSLFMAQSINMGCGDHDWVIIDTFGNTINDKNNPYPEFNGRMGGMTTLSKFNGNILYWDNFKDTVFHVHPDFTYTPVCVLEKGEHKLPMTTEGYNPLDDFLKKMSNYLILNNFLETNKFFILNYELNSTQKLAVIDKKSDKATVMDLTDSENGIENDLDNGLPFQPDKYFEIGNEKYLAAFIQPYELKTHIASRNFTKSTPKYPEKKKKLEKLANNLNENDNPLLMFVKLKE